MTEYDQLAEHYDETRGGEGRGDEYAADVDAHLPAGDGPILEIGVGTGVVALGLRRGGGLSSAWIFPRRCCPAPGRGSARWLSCPTR